MLSVVEGYSLVIILCWRQEDDFSVFNCVFNVVYDEGQPLTIGIVVSVSWRKDFRGNALAQPKIDMNIPIPYLGLFT